MTRKQFYGDKHCRLKAFNENIAKNKEKLILLRQKPRQLPTVEVDFLG